MSRRRITRPEPEVAAPVPIECHDEAPADSDPVCEPVDPQGGDGRRATAAALPGRPWVVSSWLVAVAMLLACSASVAASLWWQHRSRVIEVTRLVQRDYPAGPDASGCPNLSSCQTYASVGQRLNTLARQLFPDSTVLNSVSVTETRTGRTVRTSIVLRTDSGIVVSADAQCVPGAAAVPGRFGLLPSVGPAQADFVVAGEPGCSVAVAARIPRAVAVPHDELYRLAGDPTVQLQP